MTDSAALLWLVLVSALAVGHGCARSTSPESSRETNWLAVCEDDDDCQRSDCVCGVCSRVCSGDDECGDGIRCQGRASLLVSAACGAADEPEVTGMCAPQCEGDDDCANGQSCAEGACVPLRELDAALPALDAGTGDAAMGDAG